MFRVLFNENVNEEIEEESIFGYEKSDLKLELQVIQNMTGPSIRIFKSSNIHTKGKQKMTLLEDVTNRRKIIDDWTIDGFIAVNPANYD